MTPSELIAAYRQTPTVEVLSQIVEFFSFQPGPMEYEYPIDTHLEFRAEIVEALLPDFLLPDLSLIRALYAAEMACEAAIQRHDNLHQICFYLYELGQLEDTFRLYEAKFQARNMDVACILDREMMAVRHEVADVVAYVETVFQQQPQLQARYPTIIEELNGLVTDPSYDSLDDYRTFIRGYFHVPEDEKVASAGAANPGIPPTTEPDGDIPRPKPWWRFW